MTNRVAEGILSALREEFGENHKMYRGNMKQGIQEKPCFFVSCIKSTQKNHMGKTYKQNHNFLIQYISQNEGDESERESVADRLKFCLELIPTEGVPIRGTKMEHKVSEGVLHFTVNYNIFVSIIEEHSKMDTLETKLEGI